ncbi:hypothetical protein M741_08560 [Neisseria gonorrhoeae NOR_2011_03-06]|nr:hypothetical protein M741_08560 [Neisseria gonorrhoeae NOR_2011_03-06]
MPCIGRRHRRRYTDKRNKFPNAQRHTKHRPNPSCRLRGFNKKTAETNAV